MDIVSNHPGMIAIFTRVFEALDDVFHLFSRFPMLEAMKMYVIINDSKEMVDDVIAESRRVEADDEFIEFFTRPLPERNYFISCVTGEDKIDFVYTSVAGLRTSVVDGDETYPLNYAIYQLVDLFKDAGAIQPCSDEETGWIVNEIAAMAFDDVPGMEVVRKHGLATRTTLAS